MHREDGMGRLYMMRHGQTLFNVLHRVQGWCDSPLTEGGVEQARRAGDWFRERGIAFDHAYASTAERACDTLELAFPGLPYTREKGLREHGFGVFEGLPEETNPPYPYGDFYKVYGGETDDEARERVAKTLGAIMERPGHECVLAVSHAGACAMMLDAAGVDLTRLQAKRLGNCAVIVYDYHPASGFSLVEIVNPLADGGEA